MTTAVQGSAATHEVMNRFEVKYLMATRAVPSLLEELAPYTARDPHDSGNGYRVYSVYWDTDDLRFFWEKIEGLKFRRKLRFRRYGDGDAVFAEVKQREDRTVQKRRVVLPPEQMAALFGLAEARLDWEAAQRDAVTTEIALMIARLRLRPRLAVSYRRRALMGAFDPELRITVDGRIQYDPTRLDITRPFDVGRYALDPRESVLEIKFNHRAPLWLLKTVERRGLQMVRLSKYCNAADRCWFGGQLT